MDATTHEPLANALHRLSDGGRADPSAEWLQDDDLAAAALTAARFAPTSRCRTTLFRTDAAELVVIGWDPAQVAPIHGHGDSRCSMRVLAGEARELRIFPSKGGPSTLTRATLHEGARFAIPRDVWHDLANAAPSRMVTLHVYAPPLDAASARRTVAVIGGGASAIAVASVLDPERFQVLVVDAGAGDGCGAAYDADPACRLNVPARLMSIEGAPTNFMTWAGETGRVLEPGQFAPRALYGEYLRERVRALSSHTRIVREKVTAITRVGSAFELALQGGGALMVDQVVLATGNARPERPRGLDARYSVVDEPWRPGRLDRIGTDDELVVIGTGLTFLDVLAILEKRGHRGRITAVSRHGLLPRPHRATPIPPAELAELPADTLGLFRYVRARIESGTDWVSLMDALRHRIAAVWRAAEPAEKARFLRHLRTLWDVHRHRAPADLLDHADARIAAGTLRIVAGRLDADDVLQIRHRGGSTETLAPVPVLLATGPRFGLSPLAEKLVHSGLARAAPLDLGLDVDPDGAVIGPDGRLVDGLFAIGPERRGAEWESTAIPEIRAQAARLSTILQATSKV